MKRYVVCLAVAASIMLTGCQGQQAATEPTQSEQQHQVDFGDSIDLGSVVLTVEGIERDHDEEEVYKEFGNIAGDSALLILTGLCENVSYADFTDDTVCLNDFIHVEDEDGVTIKPEDSMFDYDPYTVAAGSYFQCPIGEKVRFAMAYEVPSDIENVTVIVGDHEIPATIGQ